MDAVKEGLIWTCTVCGEDKVNPMKNPECLSTGLESHMLCGDCVIRHAMVQGLRVPRLVDIRKGCLDMFQVIATDVEAKSISSRDASAQDMSVRYPVSSSFSISVCVS